MRLEHNKCIHNTTKDVSNGMEIDLHDSTTFDIYVISVTVTLIIMRTARTRMCVRSL